MKIRPIEYLLEIEGEPFYIIECFMKEGRSYWKVSNDVGAILSKDLYWFYEPLHSSRTEEFLASHRFLFDEAIDKLVEWLKKEDSRNE
jgi:hypothetical protein